MLTPKRCGDVSPQCPQGQEEAYRLGWWQGQIDMCDKHDGTPCQVISMQQEIEYMRGVLSDLSELARMRSVPLMQATLVKYNDRLKETSE